MVLPLNDVNALIIKLNVTTTDDVIENESAIRARTKRTKKQRKKTKAVHALNKKTRENDTTPGELQYQRS